MFITITLVVLALVTVGCIIGSAVAKDSEARTGALVIAGCAFVIGGLVAAFNMVTIVQGYEVGVPVAFGKVGAPLRSGLHVVAPWTKVETYPIRPLAVPDVKITARTSQAGQVNVTAGARWSVVPANAGELYFQVRTGDEEQISSAIVDKALGQVVGNVFATMTNANAVSDRTGAERDLRAALADQLKPYGIQVDSLFLRSVEPDAKTADSIARLAAQQRATEIAVEATKTAGEQAKQRLIEAQGLKAAAAQVAGLTPTEVLALCALGWERQQQNATDAKVSMYTTPCGSSTPLAVK